MAFKFSSICLLFFLSFSVFSCELKQNLVSLSGPVTMLLEELDLLQDKKLSAISKFHPISRKTKAEILAGGIFLSKKVLTKYSKHSLFFDKSQELKRILEFSKIKKMIEVDTRNMGSFDSFELAVSALIPYLSKCDKKLDQLKKRVTGIQKRLKSLKTNYKMIFFLGEIKQKFPELIIANDGIVKTLLDLKKLKTYSSELTYVNWSARKLESYSGFIKLGLQDGVKNQLVVRKISANKYNLIYRGLHIPGIRQIFLLEAMLQQKIL